MKDSVRIVFEVLAFVCVVFLIMQNFSLQEQIEKGQLIREEILNSEKQGDFIRSEILKEVKNICKGYKVNEKK